MASLVYEILQPSDDPALIDAASDSVITFRGLINQGLQIAESMGPPGQLVMLSCRNDSATLTAYAACLLGGHIVALIDGDTDAVTFADLAETFQPTVVAGSVGLADRRNAASTLGTSVNTTHGLDIIRTRYEPPTVHPDLRLLLSTSGTTGSRKFVRLSMRNIVSNARAIAKYLELTPGERPITSLPLHYTFGLSVVNSHWLAGAAVVSTNESLLRPAFWEAFRGHRCTSLAGVPFSFQILERMGFREMDLPSLSMLQQAGGALDPQLTATYREFMAERGGRFFVMYGQTEATARISYVPPDRLSEKVGSAGIAIPGGHLRIDRRDAADPLPDHHGEVIYEGPNVMQGYATSASDLGKGDELKGVLRTGDIGFLDGDGYLFLVGRKKRIAKVFGHRVNLDEIESMLSRHGPVAAVDGGESVWVFCAFADAGSAADTLARQLRLHRSGVVVRTVETLPTTSSGKPDYTLLQAWARADAQDD